MDVAFKEGALTFSLKGRIDSANIDELEREIRSEMSLYDSMDIAFDAEKLDYISSAGLRVLLKLKKEPKRPVRVYNVSDEVFDIFSVTGFTDILEVERMMRHISLHGCKRVSSALNGEIFSLSEDEIIKVYGKGTPLSEVKKERNYAQAALIAGIPTLIPYDVVSCESGYGIVFEKAGAESLAYVIQRDQQHLSDYARLFAVLLKEMHHTEIEEGKLPDIKDRYREWMSELEDTGDDNVRMYVNLINSLPDKPTYVHGDITINSVMIKNRELLVLDMAGSARGSALFDLQSIFASMVAIERTQEGYCRKTFGLSAEVCMKFWQEFFREYMSGRTEEIEKMNGLLLKCFVLKEKVLDQVAGKHLLQASAGE